MQEMNLLEEKSVGEYSLFYEGDTWIYSYVFPKRMEATSKINYEIMPFGSS